MLFTCGDCTDSIFRVGRVSPGISGSAHRFIRLAVFPGLREIRRVKRLTRDQVEAREGKAVRFVRDVLDNPERTVEIVTSYCDWRLLR